MGAEILKGGKGHRKLPVAYFPEQCAVSEALDRGAEPEGLSRRGAVFADLRRKGFVIGNGCRYGGDYVIYTDHPDKVHSSHTVLVVDETKPLDVFDVAGLCRVQGNVLKKAIFAAVDPRTHEPAYVGIAFNSALSFDGMKKLNRKHARAIQARSREDAPTGPP